MNRSHYQNKYYQWLSAYGALTFETAKRAARAYLSPDFSFSPVEKEKAENVLFWPLVQSGVVRYLGNKRYALSPPHAYRLVNGHYLLVNYPSKTTTSHHEKDRGNPGLTILDLPPSDPEPPVHDNFLLTDYFPLIPPFRKIITSWPVVSNQTYRQVRYRGRWTSVNERVDSDPVQIFRTTPDFGGKRAVKINGLYHSIPGERANPGAYSLAVLYADLRSGSEYLPLSIDPVACTISISSKVFPVELRKLLFIEHVVSQSAFPANNDVLTFRPAALPYLSKRLSPQHD